MIATNIDGSAAGGGNQLLDLLTLVANPDAYAKKVKGLEDLIAKNQAAINLAGPASDILALREELRVNKLAAKQAITEAEKKASKIISDAEAMAAQIRATARTNADALMVKAEAANTAAKENAAAAIAAEKAAKVASAESEKISIKLKEDLAESSIEKAKAIAAIADAEQAKKNILAKHRAFIESLR